MILKDFAKLWVSSLKHLLYMRYFIGLLQLFKTFSKTLVKEFALLQSFRLLPEPFIRARSKKSVTRDTKLFAKIVHGCRMWIWNLDMAGFVKWPLFIWIQYFVVVSKKNFKIIIIKKYLTPRSKFVDMLYYKHNITLIILFKNWLPFHSKN